jgi:ubiquinone biosynthesis accessory factor UbiJ
MAMLPFPTAQVIAPVVAATVNHLLRTAEWARERLREFAGNSVCFVVPPVSSAAFTLQPDGTLVAASADADIAATVTVKPTVLFRLVMLREEAARSEVEVTGDAALASALTGVFSALRWDVEEDLSRIVGDIAAHRIVQTGTQLWEWQARATASLAQSFAEYSTYERGLIASRQTLRHFIEAVDTLRDDTDRLEKRIERLSQARGKS